MAKISTEQLKEYPDISELLKGKEKKRRLNADRSFAEKIEIVKRLNIANRLWKNSKIVSKNK
jgi:hypothetical protein